MQTADTLVLHRDGLEVRGRVRDWVCADYTFSWGSGRLDSGCCSKEICDAAVEENPGLTLESGHMSN